MQAKDPISRTPDELHAFWLHVSEFRNQISALPLQFAQYVVQGRETESDRFQKMGALVVLGVLSYKITKEKDGFTGRREPLLLPHQRAVSLSESPSLGSIRPRRLFTLPSARYLGMPGRLWQVKLYCPR